MFFFLLDIQSMLRSKTEKKFEISRFFIKCSVLLHISTYKIDWVRVCICGNKQWRILRSEIGRNDGLAGVFISLQIHEIIMINKKDTHSNQTNQPIWFICPFAFCLFVLSNYLFFYK